MRPLLQQAPRLFHLNATFIIPKPTSRAFSRLANSTQNASSSWLQCQCQVTASTQAYSGTQWPSQTARTLRRDLHQSSNDEKAAPEEKPIKSDKDTLPDVLELPPAPTKIKSDASSVGGAEQTSRNEESAKDTVQAADNIKRVPDEHLPSHREAQRWDFSKRLTELMDELLPKLAVVTQKVNTYTGTDYSGIAALRKEIKEQEKLVKLRRAAIDDAKQALDAAHAQQASSQKEVVALLERKHSWSATDLERYMSLIRSEHINDQAVREAKEAVSTTEKALEEARSQLERRERAQYHEEQIWSDTIRRNSTWVTFGLMGLNIFLLLASLVIFEPWRRRRMVREIKMALEAQRHTHEPVKTVDLQSSAPPATIAAIEAEVDETTKPAETTTLNLKEPTPVEPSDSASPLAEHVETTLEEVTPPPIDVPDSFTETEDSAQISNTSEEVAPLETINVEEVESNPKIKSWQDEILWVAQDIISDRIISMRRIDYTTAILQGAAAGAVITAAIVAMFIEI